MDLTASPQPLPRPVGWAALGVFAVLVGYGAAYAINDDADPIARVLPGAVVAVVAAALSLVLRGPAVTVAVFAAAAAVSVVCAPTASNAGWFAACLLVGWAVWTVPYRLAGALWICVTAVFVVFAVVSPDSGWLAWIAGAAFSLLGFGVGRRQRELVVQLREAQAGLAARAQADERARIARELHDVIAHSLTVSLMHVSAARLAVAEDPADADRALAEAERLGRASLDEVRHAVGTLRTRDGAAGDPTAPLPGSTDLAGLVAGFESAGMDLHASLDGELTALPATVGLAAYRIVQEALTNAAKHAPGRRTTVHVAANGHTVLIDVDSAGVPGHGAGLGLVGMRERAASVGGRCDTGPGGSGWRVHAELPVELPVELPGEPPVETPVTPAEKPVETP